MRRTSRLHFGDTITISPWEPAHFIFDGRGLAQSFLFHRGRASAEARPWLTGIISTVESLTLRIVWWISARIGPDRAGRFGALLLGTIGPHLAKSAHLRANLAIAMPNLGEHDLDDLTKRAWRETGRVMGEFPNFGTICVDEAADRLEIIEQYDMEPLRRGERQAILVSGHFANWELAAGCSRKVGFPLDVLYSPQANEDVDTMIRHHRQALGVGLIPRQQAARAILRSLAARRNFGVLLDQRYDDGEPVPFFGHDTPSGIAPAMLAIRQGVDYVPVRIERKKDAHFRVTFLDAIKPDPALDSPREQAIEMTRTAYALFETWITEKPESWLCLKRRWPRHVYRLRGIDI